jgi:pyruvate/2-oxoglutarate dehydrogenase complex dihydrolipoamide acyltransferase (E2) component
MGASEVDTPEKLRDQIIRLDSYNRCDRELGAMNAANAPAQSQPQGQKTKSQSQQRPPQHSQGASSTPKTMNPEKTAAVNAKRLESSKGTASAAIGRGIWRRTAQRRLPHRVLRQETSRQSIPDGIELARVMGLKTCYLPVLMTQIVRDKPQARRTKLKISQCMLVTGTTTRCGNGALTMQPTSTWLRIAATSPITPLLARMLTGCVASRSSLPQLLLDMGR